MRNILIFLSFFSCFLFQAKAQHEETELLKPFKAKLAESSKKNSLPILPKLDTTIGQLNYDLPTHQISLKYPDPVIRPLAMPAGETTQSHSFYAKVGFGYPISPNAELSYYKSNKNLKFGVNADHLSSAGNLKNQNFGNTHFDIGATYFTPVALAVGLDLGFNLDAYRFYGYHLLPDSLQVFSPEVAKDSVSQRFLEFYGTLSLFNSTLGKAQFNYNVDLGFQVMNDKYGAAEFVLKPHVAVDKWLGKGAYKHRIFTDIDVNLANYSFDTTKSNRLLANFHPGADFNFGIFKFTTAANLGLNEGNFFIMPDVKLHLGLSEGAFNIFAAWTGEMRTNTFRTISRYNPFISSNLSLHHTKYNDIYGGVSGNVRGIGYEVRAGYALTKNMPIFVNDATQNYLRFGLLYDNLNIINIKGTVDFRMVENLAILLTAGYNIYTGGNYGKAYHLPTLETNLSVQYKIKHLLLKSEFFVNAGTPYMELVTNANKTLGGLFDINLAASYWFGKKVQNFGAFIELNNLLNNKNQRWYLYPQIGFNARAGMLMKF